MAYPVFIWQKRESRSASPQARSFTLFRSARGGLTAEWNMVDKVPLSKCSGHGLSAHCALTLIMSLDCLDELFPPPHQRSIRLLVGKTLKSGQMLPAFVGISSTLGLGSSFLVYRYRGMGSCPQLALTLKSRATGRCWMRPFTYAWGLATKTQGVGVHRSLLLLILTTLTELRHPRGICYQTAFSNSQTESKPNA